MLHSCALYSTPLREGVSFPPCQQHSPAYLTLPYPLSTAHCRLMIMINKAKTCHLTLYIQVIGNETAEKKARRRQRKSRLRNLPYLCLPFHFRLLSTHTYFLFLSLPPYQSSQDSVYNKLIKQSSDRSFCLFFFFHQSYLSQSMP